MFLFRLLSAPFIFQAAWTTLDNDERTSLRKAKSEPALSEKEKLRGDSLTKYMHRILFIFRRHEESRKQSKSGFRIDAVKRIC